MDLFKTRADTFERFTQPTFQRALQLLVDGAPDALEFLSVVSLKLQQPVVKNVADGSCIGCRITPQPAELITQTALQPLKLRPDGLRAAKLSQDRDLQDNGHER
ncbi:MAG TPA: hypothetical protein VES20_20145 [Bryobacteraceae bacterium]|nr:hypothetical protein [Bryobacteraceae bacterium]